MIVSIVEELVLSLPSSYCGTYTNHYSPPGSYSCKRLEHGRRPEFLEHKQSNNSWDIQHLAAYIYLYRHWYFQQGKKEKQKFQTDWCCEPNANLASCWLLEATIWLLLALQIKREPLRGPEFNNKSRLLQLPLSSVTKLLLWSFVKWDAGRLRLH